MLTKTSVIRCVLALLMLVYLAVMLPLAKGSAASRPYAGVQFAIADSLGTGFVNADDIRRECRRHFGGLESISSHRIPLYAMERVLGELPQIESVNAAVLCNGQLRLDIVPMVPVARVFDRNRSYYINRSGKRIAARIDYHIDVPVVSGHFDSINTPARLLPVLDYIKSHPDLNDLVSAVNTNRQHDIILVPVIRGHVVNFGDTSLIADKFARLKSFYHNVMPVKGWDYYESISLKWRGQIVATRHDKPRADRLDIAPEEAYIDMVPDSMLTVPPQYPPELLGRQ
ncbi:MAG: cell division protein FtsQ/DivIB [Muribaculaceae bacterium]|nr:cell division protein FtsQ/DivIB [Muribaculaceae bacterium]